MSKVEVREVKNCCVDFRKVCQTFFGKIAVNLDFRKRFITIVSF